VTLLSTVHDIVAQLALGDGLRRFLTLAVVFLPFELVFPAHRQRVLRRGLVSDVLFYFVGPLLVLLPMAALLGGLASVGAWLTPAAVQRAMQGQPLWLQAVEAAIIGDLGIYLGHRVQHEVPALWRFHAVHHSAEELDWIAGARFHPIDILITRGVSFGMLYALGFEAPAIYLYLAIYTWESFGVHANVPTDFGPLRYLFVSPVSHHWHHSKDQRAWGKNYAGFIALWDVLFGTFFLPRGERPGNYGTADPVPHDFVGQLLFPFRRHRAAEAPAAPAGAAPPVVAPDGALGTITGAAANAPSPRA
jgi:sterol desaturase/sphingolipid hydroxylase (fatty acid hydroxylase superfamily)